MQEEELCNIAFPMCICRLTLACISSENSTTLLGMPTHLDRSSLTAAGPYLMPTGHFCCPVSTRHSHHHSPTTLFSVSLYNSYWRSPAYFRLRRDLESKPFVWFPAKTDKGIICLADHLHYYNHNENYWLT